MGLDIKIPIGLMFSILGLLLTIYGISTSGSVIYEQSLNININLWTGGGMLIIGIILLISSRLKLFAKKLEESIEEAQKENQ